MTALKQIRIDGRTYTLGDMTGYARLNSPTFTGYPKAPTMNKSDKSTSIATTSFVNSVVSDYTKTADLGSLATKSSITHSEVSDWSTATAGFLTSSQDLNGWLHQAVAKANTDLNTIVEQGVYNVSTSSANASAHHYPVGVNGIMIVLRTNAVAGQGFCQQYFRRTGTAGTNDHHMYVREASSGGTGTWGAWVQIMTSKNLSTNGGTIATTSYVDDAIAAITDADNTSY